MTKIELEAIKARTRKTRIKAMSHGYPVDLETIEMHPDDYDQLIAEVEALTADKENDVCQLLNAIQEDDILAENVVDRAAGLIERAAKTKAKAEEEAFKAAYVAGHKDGVDGAVCCDSNAEFDWQVYKKAKEASGDD